MICFLCGKPLAGKRTAKYYLAPTIIRKWTNPNSIQTKPELSIKVETHASCAARYQGTITLLASERFKSLSEADQVRYRSAYENSISIARYVNTLSKVVRSQNNKCAYCDTKITMETAVLRRRDCSKPRVCWNADAVCIDCNHLMNKINYQLERSQCGSS